MRKPRITFATAAELAIADARTRIRLGENAPTLERDYIQRDRYCQPFFGKMPISTIDNRVLREFRQHLIEKSLKAPTIGGIMSFVSVALRLAEEDGLLDRLPNVPRVRQKDCPRPHFTRSQYTRLLKFLAGAEVGKPVVKARRHPVDQEMRAIVTFMVNSFTRPGDNFVLRHRQVEVISPTGDRPSYLRLNLPPSKGHPYPVITMPAAVPIYERARRRHAATGLAGPDDYVFMPRVTNRTTAKEIVRRQFGEVLKALGMETNAEGEAYSLYSFRHTAIMFRLLNAENLDLLTLARACRTSVEMIDRYYAKPLTAEMNRDKLHSFRHPTRYTTALT